MRKHAMFGCGLAAALLFAGGVARADWGPGDEMGNGNTQGYATRLRCVDSIASSRSKVYEIGRPYSQTMPQALFGDAPVAITYKPTLGLPFTRHAANGEVMTAGFGSQGTQMDALGHFGFLDAPYFGGPFPADQVHYYNGFTQADVKPTADSPLLHLGIDKAPPIMTSAVLLDAVALRGRPLEAGELITADDIVAMLQNEKLAKRGILPGDVVYIYTGWGGQWQDPAPDPAHTPYYLQGPGLSVDAQQYLAQRTIVLVALDNPFTDPFRPCEVDGSCPPPSGTAPGLPFNIHHNDLTQDGIYQIQNLKLDEMAADRTWLSCTVILPLRLVGAAGSAVRPIAIGVPSR
jgi:kynurenine formamidase